MCLLGLDGVLILTEVDRLRISSRPDGVHLALVEVSLHLAATHLIVVLIPQMLRHVGILPDQGPLDGTIFHKKADRVAGDLRETAPDEGATVHLHHRVLSEVDHRVSDCLCISTPSADISYTLSDIIDRVDLDQLHPIRTGKEVIGVGVLVDVGMVYRLTALGGVVVHHMIAPQLHTLSRIPEDDAPIEVGKVCGAVVDQRVTRHPSAAGDDLSPVKERRHVLLRPVGPASSVDDTAVALDRCGTEDGSDLGIGVVVQRIGVEGEVVILQHDVVVEDRRLIHRGVLRIDAREHIETVGHRAVVEVVGDPRHTIVVQAISEEGILTLLHLDQFSESCQLRVAVVVQIVAVDIYRILRLVNVDVTEGLESIGLPVEECAVAVHQRIIVLEDDIPSQDLRIGIDLLIEAP